MSRKKKSRERPRSLGKKPTLKQAAFLRHYMNPRSCGFGNATRASELAGYKGKPGSNQLAVQGVRNLRRFNIKEAVARELYKQGCTPAFIAGRIIEAMRATEVRVLPDRKGRPVLYEFPKYTTRLQGSDRAARFLDTTHGHHGNKSAAEVKGGELPGDGELLKTEKLAEEVSELSSADRMFMRSAAEKVRAMLKLVASDESSVEGERPGE